MSDADIKQFTDAVTEADKSFFLKDWAPSITILNGLSMPDMLNALNQISDTQRGAIWQQALFMMSTLGAPSIERISFAMYVLNYGEITEASLPDDQINAGRQFLGCTPMDDTGVQAEIDKAINQAKAQLAYGNYLSYLDDLDGDAKSCCGYLLVAWQPLLADERAIGNNSLISNKAAAAHYMLCRTTVCAGNASPAQMKAITDGYDLQKRTAYAAGDKNLKSIAQVSTSRPFPPDFAIRKWAAKGADAGEADRSRCNSNAHPSTIAPNIGGRIWGVKM